MSSAASAPSKLAARGGRPPGPVPICPENPSREPPEGPGPRTGASDVSAAREACGIRRCGADRAGLVDGLLIFRLGVAVPDHAAAGLDVETAVLHHRRPQSDAHVHVAPRREVA